MTYKNWKKSIISQNDTIATAIFVLQVKNLKEFDRIVRNISKVKSIDSVERTRL